MPKKSKHPEQDPPDSQPTASATSNTNLGEGFQWRPEQFLLMFQQLLQTQLPPTSPTPPVPPPLAPTFSGRPDEDVDSFLTSMQEYLIASRVITNDWGRYAVKQLEGEAAKYYEPFVHMLENFATFCQRLRRRYDGPKVRADLTSKLFSEKQKAAENAEVFLALKERLLVKLFPNMGDAERVAVLTPLLHPELQPHVIASAPTTIPELTEVCTRLEAVTPKTIAPTVLQRPVQLGAPRHTMTPAESSRSPKCRNCPGYHWHRDCPDRQRPGNGRQAEDAGRQN